MIICDMIEYMKKHGLRYPYDIVEISFDSTKSNDKKRTILDFKMRELIGGWN